MVPADIVRSALIDAPGEAFCDSCLAFACSTSLAEMREITKALLAKPGFDLREACVGCRRTVPAVAYTAKCAHCSAVIRPRESSLLLAGDLLHAVCLRLLVSDQAIRVSHDLNAQSRRLIEDARRQIQRQRSGDSIRGAA